ncbi:MAG TPA: GNAT family protein [Devosia sp.]|nr:GNAT family protein [Devosia sp.]
MTSPNLPIETERLRLRLFEGEDFDALLAYSTLPEVQRYLDWKARDHVEVKSVLEVLTKQVALNRPGDTLALAVVRKADDKMIGQVCLNWYDATAAQGEFRCIINPVYRRQGYGKEAAQAAITLGFDSFRFHRIFARCDARNAASARMLKSLGMRLEAHYREHALFQGDWDEELHFAVLDREWRRSHNIHDFPSHRLFPSHRVA